MDFVNSLMSMGGPSGGQPGGGPNSSLLTAGQGIMTVFSALSKIGAGQADADRLDTEAWQTERQAKTEEINSLQRQTEMKRRLLRVLGETDVAFAAAGVDLTQGVAAEANKTAEARAADAINMEQTGLEAALGQYSERSRILRRQSKLARRAGYVDAIGGILQSAADMYERG